MLRDRTTEHREHIGPFQTEVTQIEVQFLLHWQKWLFEAAVLRSVGQLLVKVVAVTHLFDVPNQELLERMIDHLQIGHLVVNVFATEFQRPEVGAPLAQVKRAISARIVFFTKGLRRLGNMLIHKRHQIDKISGLAQYGAAVLAIVEVLCAKQFLNVIHLPESCRYGPFQVVHLHGWAVQKLKQTVPSDFRFCRPIVCCAANLRSLCNWQLRLNC